MLLSKRRSRANEISALKRAHKNSEKVLTSLKLWEERIKKLTPQSKEERRSEKCLAECLAESSADGCLASAWQRTFSSGKSFGSSEKQK